MKRYLSIAVLTVGLGAGSALAQSQPPLTSSPQINPYPAPGTTSPAPTGGTGEKVTTTSPAPAGSATPTATEHEESSPAQSTGPAQTPPAPLSGGAAAKPPEAGPAKTTEVAPGVNLPFRLYGFLNPRMIVSSHAVESFGQGNASAITAAGNPRLAFDRDDARLTLQVAQSRFGLWLGEGKPVRGLIEMDFIDFAKSSPTVQANPRLRIAKVEVEMLDKKLLLIAGQDWDLHAPVNHHGINIVGGAFLNGNTGFMRQQLKLIYLSGKIEAGAAIGLQGINATARDNAIELSRFPSFAARIAYVPNAKSRIGVSGIASDFRFYGPAAATGGVPERRAFSGAAALYGDFLISPMTNVRWEGYIARNAQNFGLLALGTGDFRHDIDEVGGFISIRQQLVNEMNWIFGYAGIASVLNKGVMNPGYAATPTAAGGFTYAASGQGFGISQNITGHLGYEYRPVANLAFMVEGFWYRTNHKLIGADVTAVSSEATAAGAEVGVMYTF